MPRSNPNKAPSHSLSTEAVAAKDFGIDIEQDLLRAVVGSPADEALGNRVTGMDALGVTVPTTLGAIPALLESYLKAYESDAYKASYGWVDRISEVTTPATIGLLDGRLLTDIQGDPSERLWLAVPEIIDWGRVEGFRFTGSRDLNIDLHLRDFLSSLPAEQPLSVDLLKTRKAFAIDASTNRAFDSWPVYSCICFEASLDGRVYLLSGGRWFSVDPDFVREVDEYIANVPVVDIGLPEYTHQSEEDYNKGVTERFSSQFALLDKKLLRLNYGSSIEPCDLLTPDHKLVHVKRYSGGSKAMSHLFAQGLVSASLLLGDCNFRRALNELVDEPFRIGNPLSPINPQDFEIVFAVISFSKKNQRLPFFSKVNLRNNGKRLEAMRYRMGLTFVYNATPKPARKPARRKGRSEGTDMAPA